VIALVRTEFTKAFVRLRTVIIAAILVGLPTLIVVAIHARGNRVRDNGDNGEGLFRLAHLSGLLVPAAVLAAMSGFLLVVIAGTLAGDSVAGDASWGNLRYLLMRPVPRGRLLFAKAFVAGVLIWTCTILVVLTAAVGGITLFGSHAVAVPGQFDLTTLTRTGGFTLTVGTLLARTAFATAYVAFGFTALLALGTFFSTLTDTSAGAIGATIGVYIISEILGAITQLGTIRYAFPTYYLDAWQSMFTSNSYSKDMVAGLIVQCCYLAVFGTAAIVWFKRKDIRS
jgi:ABC-2 type transport system permease protein